MWSVALSRRAGLPGDAANYTGTVFERLGDQNAALPLLFICEFSNVFLELSRQRKLSTKFALGTVQRFAASGLAVARNTPDP